MVRVISAIAAAQGSLGLAGDTSQRYAGVEAPHTASRAKLERIHEHVETQDEQVASVRGASLRELEKFLAKEDPRGTYAGLQKVGDDSDGTAVWTALTDPEEVRKALERRVTSRRAERRLQEAASLVMLKAKFASKLRDAVEAMRGEDGPS